MLHVHSSAPSSGLPPAALGLAALAALAACGPADLAAGSGGAGGEGGGDSEHACHAAAQATRFASCVESFTPGPGAGHGQKYFPEIVYDEPQGGGLLRGSTHVLSLGRGGEIVVGFGGNSIVDGEGADFVVFENPFHVDDNSEDVFAELGEVAVSQDGITWHVFPCQKDVGPPFEGCAGWRPVLAHPDNDVDPLDPDEAGGDPFDLAELGLKSARFVRIRDVSNIGTKPNAGFDLDAVGIVNAASP